MMEWCYLYCLAAPLGTARHQAQHYIGTTRDLAARDALHRSGRGARMLAAAVERGISFRVVRLWPGGRDVERWLKRRKEAHKLCPVCSGAMAWRRAFVVPATQLVLPGFSDLDEPAPWELPGYQPPSNQVDGYEAWYRRRLGSGPHVPLPVCDDGELW